MTEPLYPVIIGATAVSRIGFINARGEKIFEVPGEIPMGVHVGRAFIRPVRKKSELVLIDDRGREANRIVAEWAKTYANGYCVVEVSSNNLDPARVGSFDQGLVDMEGKITVQTKYANLSNVHEGFYVRRRKENESYSLYSIKGRLIIRSVGIGEKRVSEGIIATCDPSSKGVFGYKRVDGSWLLTPQFDTALPFYKGLAPVVKLAKHKYTASLIDTSGKDAVSLSSVEGFEGEFSSDGVIAFRSPKCDGYLDTAGRVLVSGHFDLLGRMENGVAPVKVSGAWGLIDKEGKWRRKPEFGAFHRQHGQFFAFHKSRIPTGEEIVLNSDGEIIWPSNKR